MVTQLALLIGFLLLLLGIQSREEVRGARETAT